MNVKNNTHNTLLVITEKNIMATKKKKLHRKLNRIVNI